MRVTTRRLLALLLLLLVLAVLATFLWRPTTRAVVTYYVSQVDGSDSASCADAQSAARPKSSINGGVSCLTGGDVLLIAPGLYAEWLVTQMNSTDTVEQRYLDVQPGTKSIPNGLSASQPTRLVAGEGGKVTLSPTTKNPETGAIIGAIGSYARFISFEGVHLPKAGGRDERTQGAGIFLADSQDITVRGGSVYRGTVKASMGSQRLTFEGMEVSFSGEGCDFTQGDPTTGYQPCPHGMYLCGQGHIIRSNYVHDFAHTGIQVSCEQGSSSATIHGNRIVTGPGPGISIKGAGSVVANVVEGCGTGIRSYGALVAENTVSDYFRNSSWVPDPWGIIYDGGAQVFGNLIYKQKSAYNLITQQQFKPIDTTAVHHNMCDVSGNAGCTMIHAPDTVFVDYAARDYTLKESAPARRAGVAHAAVTVDIRRTPYGTPPDLGAHSYGTPTPPPDTTPPTVQLTAPEASSTVFGTQVALLAVASDNVAVVTVQFQVDGQDVGTTQRSAPYQATWDSTTVPNGHHTVSATATDAAGWSSTATSSLRVDNPVPPEPPGTPVLACSGTIHGTALEFTCTKPQEGRR